MLQNITDTQVLGRSIRQERRNQGLRQQDLADLSQVSVRFLSDLEGGKPSVEFQKALAVLKTLGLNLMIQSRGDQLCS